MRDGLFKGEDGQARCWWCGDDPLYREYHDHEWGRPCRDDVKLYEKLCLEGFQAGLSWLTILRKRENFRAAFAGFDFEKVASFTDKDIERLLHDPGIIRHRGKIESAIHNAQKVCEIIAETGSLYSYFQNFKPEERNRPSCINYETLVKLTETAESRALSEDLKKRGLRFIGPTTLYAHMQATGMINDHLEGCFVREEIEKEQRTPDQQLSSPDLFG